MALPVKVQHKVGIGSITLDTAPIPGNLLVAFVARRSGSMGAGWTNGGDATNQGTFANLRYRLVVGGDPAGPWAVPAQGPTVIVEVAGVLSAINTNAILSEQGDPPAGLVVCGGPVIPTAGRGAFIIGGANIGHGDLDVISAVPEAGWIELMDQKDAAAGRPFGWCGYQIVAAAAGGYTPSATATNTFDGYEGWGGISAAWVAAADAAAPAVGEPGGSIW